MSVSISLDIGRDSPPTTAQIHGSVRVEIDGNVVTRFTDADGTEIEYVGTWVTSDVGDVLETLVELKRGSVGLYETTTVSVHSFVTYLLFEPLSSHEVRLAFQRYPNPGDPPVPEPLPPVEVSRGYVTDVDEIAGVVAASTDVLFDFVEEVGLDPNNQALNWIADRVDELESLVEEYEGIRYETGDD